jgi:hypothetical protein
MSAIVRPDAAQQRLGLKSSHFDEHFVWHKDDEPNIPGTNIPRLKPVPLGVRAIGFFSDELDSLITALRALRDSGVDSLPFPPRPLPQQPKRERETPQRARRARR